MNKQLRQIICYDQLLGHRYVPNIHVRIRYGKGDYYLETDENGFRNSSNKPKGLLKILVIGDSYTAGDGVSNAQRFTDILQTQFDCEVTNLAVSGYGVDQQLLTYEQFGNKIKHDLILFCPHLDDLKRNLLSARKGVDKDTGRKIMVPKPYFELKEDKLILKNNPVPKFRPKVTVSKEKIEAKAKIIPPKEDGFISNKIKTARYYIDRLSYTALNKQYKPELASADSKEWQMMDALIQRLKKRTNNIPILTVPFPYDNSVKNKEKPKFLNLFKKHETAHFKVVDIVTTLHKNYDVNNNTLFLPLCGHFTPLGHQIIANEIQAVLCKEFGLKKRTILSPKISKNKPNYILGISCFYHDSAAAIIKDGAILAAVQEERFTRKKHDPAFPKNAINYCLEEAKISVQDLNAIVYYDNESWTIERVMHNAMAIGKKQKQFWRMASNSLFQKLKLSSIIRNTLNYTGQIYKTEHHISHAASAYYPSPYDEAAILIVDGVGEWACSTIAVGNKNDIKILKQQRFPHSLGLLYSAFTYFTGFRVNSGEYKLMGLAPYGKPIYADRIKEHVLDIKEDGSIFLNMDLFSFLEGEKMTNDKFAKIFDGPARARESKISKREMDIAASIQKVTEEIFVKMANHAYKITGKKHLVLAGGVALNCVANGVLYDETPFEDIFIQPASGDAGGALGAALELYYQEFYKERDEKHTQSKQEHSFLGPGFSSNEIYHYLNTKDIPFHSFQNGSREEHIAQLLTDNKIIGYFDGRMEYGPRALGARSILGNPLDTEMQSKLNLKIKFRESFRPFAPIYAEEKTAEYFDFDRPSPYMLVVRPINENLKTETESLNDDEDLVEWVNQERSKIPAITHVDYSARLQSVNKESNPTFHKILKEFEKNTGYAVLINTSFNVRGEPIVCAPKDAYQCFMRTHMDVLVLGNYYLIKEEQPEWQDTEKWQEIFELD